MAGQKNLLLTGANCCLFPQPVADFTTRDYLWLNEAPLSSEIDISPLKMDLGPQLAHLFAAKGGEDRKCILLHN
jgi:hypothetical protein